MFSLLCLFPFLACAFVNAHVTITAPPHPQPTHAALELRAPQADFACSGTGDGDLPACAEPCQATMSSDAAYQSCIGAQHGRDTACRCQYLAGCGGACGVCWPTWYASWSADWCPGVIGALATPTCEPLDVNLATQSVPAFTDVTVTDAAGQATVSQIMPPGYAHPTDQYVAGCQPGSATDVPVPLAPNTSELIPWPWAIAPIDTAAPCPGWNDILVTFAIVDVVTALLSVLVGHRRVLRVLTCRLFGRDGSRSWRFLWPVQLGLQLGGNAFVAARIVQAPGLLPQLLPAAWDLMLFYVARPRLGWLLLPFLAHVGRAADAEDYDPAAAARGKGRSG